MTGQRAVARYYIMHGSFLQDACSTAIWITQARGWQQHQSCGVFWSEAAVCDEPEGGQPCQQCPLPSHPPHLTSPIHPTHPTSLGRQIVLLLVHRAGGVPLSEGSGAFQYIRIVRMVRWTGIVRQVINQCILDACCVPGGGVQQLAKGNEAAAVSRPYRVHIGAQPTPPAHAACSCLF